MKVEIIQQLIIFLRYMTYLHDLSSKIDKSIIH